LTIKAYSAIVADICLLNYLKIECFLSLSSARWCLRRYPSERTAPRHDVKTIGSCTSVRQKRSRWTTAEKCLLQRMVPQTLS
jgi:hypothetical protein